MNLLSKPGRTRTVAVLSQIQLSTIEVSFMYNMYLKFSARFLVLFTGGWVFTCLGLGNGFNCYKKHKLIITRENLKPAKAL